MLLKSCAKIAITLCQSPYFHPEQLIRIETLFLLSIFEYRPTTLIRDAFSCTG